MKLRTKLPQSTRKTPKNSLFITNLLLQIDGKQPVLCIWTVLILDCLGSGLLYFHRELLDNGLST